MTIEMFWEIFIPFIGTTLGAGCVCLMKGSLNIGLQKMSAPIVQANDGLT